MRRNYKTFRAIFNLPVSNADLDWLFTHNSVRRDKTQQDLWRQYELLGDRFLRFALTQLLMEKISDPDSLHREVEERVNNKSPYMKAIATKLGFDTLIQSQEEKPNEQMMVDTLEALFGLCINKKITSERKLIKSEVVGYFVNGLPKAAAASVSVVDRASGGGVAAAVCAGGAGFFQERVVSKLPVEGDKVLRKLSNRVGEMQYTYMMSWLNTKVLEAAGSSNAKDKVTIIDSMKVVLLESKLDCARPISRLGNHSIAETLGLWASKRKGVNRAEIRTVSGRLLTSLQESPSLTF